MESFEVDVDPGQIVRWVVAEHKTAASQLRTIARRRTETREIPARREYHLDDEDREDLTEVATIGTLEIAPAHEHDGWLLTVTVEDDLGPRETSGGLATEAEQQIDLGTFYNEFVRPGRGTTTVVAEVAGPAARQNVGRLLASIERNQHALEPRSSAT